VFPATDPDSRAAEIGDGDRDRFVQPEDHHQDNDRGKPMRLGRQAWEWKDQNANGDSRPHDQTHDSAPAHISE
jgi:hypothetical protein